MLTTDMIPTGSVAVGNAPGAPVPDPAPEIQPETQTTPETPAAPSTFADAGAALRGAKTWGELNAPTGEPGKDPGEAAQPEQPGQSDASQPDAFDNYTVDGQGVLHRPDGTFADEQEIAAYNASIPAEGEQPAPADGEQPTDAIVVQLKGRNGEDLEIEVTDPALAEAIRANHNDGMRGKEFARRMEAVEAAEGELRAFRAMLETNPEAVILQHLPADKQVSIATALIAQHWDAVYDRLLGFEQDPSQRIRTAADTQLAIRDQQRDYERQVSAMKQAATITTAVQSLIPETADEAVSEQFLVDAQADLIRAHQSGQPITPESVATILAPRLRLYAPLWGQADASGATTAPPPAKPARPIARPVARPASAQAPASAGATTATAGTTAAKAGATVRRAVTAQRIAAAVPPAGAGAAPVQRSPLPANATLAEAVALQKKQRTWSGQ